MLVLASATALPASQAKNPFLGAWNITGTGEDSAIIMWLEVTEEAGQLRGMFLNRTGNPAPLGYVAVEGDELLFSQSRANPPTGTVYRAKIENGKLAVRYTVTQGRGGRGRRGAPPDPNAPPPPPPTERVVNLVGVRPPVWPPSDANGKHAYGAPVQLFDNKSLDMWDVQFPNRPIGWRIEDGAMTNSHVPLEGGQRRQAGNNLVSKQKFMNFKLEAEYKLAPNSNGGIYLRGRYELQVLDVPADAKPPRPDLSHMAIYGRTPPRVDASKPAGEWQTLEVVLVGNRVTVTLNGQRVHDNAAILGVTGGTLDNDELSPGPLMLQGDHSDVWFRKLTLTPIK
jgi:hypothetical protein